MKKIFLFLVLVLINISCENSVSPTISTTNPTKLMYISDESGNYEIYCKYLVTNIVTRLTNSPEFKNKPHFFPDGQRILYSTSYTDGGKIFSININGTNNLLLADSCEYNPLEDISPNGQLIVYQKEFSIPPSIYTLTTIVLMNSNGTNKRIISPNPGAQPRFSHDGNLICYTNYGGAEPNKIMLYNIETQKTDSIAVPGLGGYEAILNPRFSPSDEKILFCTNIDSSHALYTIHNDGTNLTKVSPYNFFTQDFTYSPDGKYIIMAKWDGSVQHIYKINEDGSNLTLLSAENSFELNPECSRDASQIVISSKVNNDRNYKIIIMDIDGNNRNNLVSSQNKVFNPTIW